MTSTLFPVQVTQTHSGIGNNNNGLGDINETHVHYGSHHQQSEVPKKVEDALKAFRELAQKEANPVVKAEALRIAEELTLAAKSPRSGNKSELQTKSVGWEAGIKAMGAGADLVNALQFVISALSLLCGTAPVF
jgi:hypothetical protein